MKSSARPLPRPFAVLAAVGFGLALTVSGCSRHADTRPASSLSEQDRAVLDDYEQIRAALAADNLLATHYPASDLVKKLTPTDTKALAPAALAPAAGIMAAPALDRARQIFKRLSAAVIPKASGVEGYYVMTCAMPSAGDWVQRSPNVDNPYFGKDMHDFGDLKK